jgi:hypothetical protein
MNKRSESLDFPRRPAAAPDDRWLGLVRRKFNF